MNYEGILGFKGTWRNYQARVLEHADRYMSDGKIHIVAAPGSGKTTLGIELIRRMNGKALILAPSITIREQWIARIEEAFLCEGVRGEDFLSQNLKQPKAITVATYQALHSAMTRFRGMQEDAGGESGTDECLTENETEEVDYSGFDLVAAMKEAGIEVLCLDECHHLRSEWWKALEDFKKQVDNLKIIALTATPPYDSTPAMWTRYMNKLSGGFFKFHLFIFSLGYEFLYIFYIFRVVCFHTAYIIDLQKYLKNFLFPVDIWKSKREEPPGPSLLGVKLIKV